MILKITTASRSATAVIRAQAIGAIRSCRALLSDSDPCELRNLPAAIRRVARM
jgi:hypothetical protein